MARARSSESPRYLTPQLHELEQAEAHPAEVPRQIDDDVRKGNAIRRHRYRRDLHATTTPNLPEHDCRKDGHPHAHNALNSPQRPT